MKNAVVKNMTEEKRRQVYEILLMPIKCEKHCGFGDDRKPEIKIHKEEKESYIISTETYWPYYPNGHTKRYEFKADCDMADFACGFYEIIYASLLNGKTIVNGKDGNLVNKQFSGDTMTSVSRLPELKNEYHCLANFWVLPMELGRKSIHELSKTSNRYDIKDFMDRFLLLLSCNIDKYKNNFPEYFSKVYDFKMFSDIHMLSESYIDENNMVLQYSNDINEFTAEYLRKAMRKRAEKISESEYTSQLWDYFNKCELFV